MTQRLFSVVARDDPRRDLPIRALTILHTHGALSRLIGFCEALLHHPRDFPFPRASSVTVPVDFLGGAVIPWDRDLHGDPDDMFMESDYADPVAAMVPVKVQDQAVTITLSPEYSGVMVELSGKFVSGDGEPTPVRGIPAPLHWLRGYLEQLPAASLDLRLLAFPSVGADHYIISMPVTEEFLSNLHDFFLRIDDLPGSRFQHVATELVVNSGVLTYKYAGFPLLGGSGSPGFSVFSITDGVFSNCKLVETIPTIRLTDSRAGDTAAEVVVDVSSEAGRPEVVKSLPFLVEDVERWLKELRGY